MNISEIKPMNDRVLVQPEAAAESKSAGGIILPQTREVNHRFAKVIAVGAGILKESGVRQPLGVNVGDRLLLSKAVGFPFTLNEQEYLFIKENDITAIV